MERRGVDLAKGPLLAPHPQTPSLCSCLPCVVQNFCCSRLPGRRPERQSCQPRNRKPTFRDDQKDKPVSKEVESRSVDLFKGTFLHKLQACIALCCSELLCSRGLRVSSNAIEGLFSRAKRHLRTYRGSPQSKEQVGDYLGEFLFRARFLKAGAVPWRNRALVELLVSSLSVAIRDGLLQYQLEHL